MSPRNYKMTKRAAAVEEKRRAIVQATLELHAEKGVEKTGWDDIAARAGVGVGTVYRHFPTLDELLPACGALTFRKLDLPGVEIFDGIPEREGRVRRLVEALFALYERGEKELRNIREESEYHPVLAESRRDVEARIDSLVSAAVGGRHDVVAALTDIRTWQALRDRAVADPVGVTTGLVMHVLGERQAAD